MQGLAALIGFVPGVRVLAVEQPGASIHTATMGVQALRAINAGRGPKIRAFMKVSEVYPDIEGLPDGASFRAWTDKFGAHHCVVHADSPEGDWADTTQTASNHPGHSLQEFTDRALRHSAWIYRRNSGI